MKKTFILTLCLILGVFSGTLFAAEVSLFGPIQYVRTTGAPDVFTGSFTGISGSGMLIVKNGAIDGGNRITDAISSASVNVNGEQIFGTSDFNQNVYLLQAPVNLTENNSITVELASNPGSYLTIEITQEQQQEPPTVTFSADPANIMINESSTLSWSSSNTDTCIIDQGVGSVDVTGSISVSPTQTTTYTITASGSGGTATASVTVTVNSQPPPTVSISADPETIQSGETSTLIWSSANADTCVIDQGVGSVDVTGSISVSPAQTTTYTITATGSGGTATASVTVTVIFPPPTVTLSAEPETIQIGGTSTLTWISTNAICCFFNPDIGPCYPNGSATVSPSETTTYTIIVSGSGGTATASVTITVSSQPPPTVSISSNPEIILLGESSTLTWSSTNADSCIIEPGIGSVDVNGTMVVTPTESTTYTITATGSGGTATASSTVTVSPIGISITSPLDGDTLSRPDTLVQGTIINPLGNEVGVNINGTVAMVYGNQFVANHVPLGEGGNTIIATATDADGNTATASITIDSVTTGDYIKIMADTESAVSPLETPLEVDGSFRFTESSITYTGPGTVEFLENSSHEYSVEIIEEGIYYFTAEVADDQNNTYTDTIAIVVLDQAQLDALLRFKWDAMRQALITGDIESAVIHFRSNRTDTYNEVFQAYSSQLGNMLPGAQHIELVEISSRKARYIAGIEIVDNGQVMTAGSYIIFELDEDGLWRIIFF